MSEEYLIDEEEMTLTQVKPSQNTSYLLIPVDVNSLQLTKASKHTVHKNWGETSGINSSVEM